MFNIKFNALDIDGKIVYCYSRNPEDGKKVPAVERTFPYEAFVELVPELAEMLEGDVYSIYLQDDFSEWKSLDGTEGRLSEEQVDFIKNLIIRACTNLEFDDLLRPPSIDDQIDEFIKEFFEEEDDPVEQKDFLADFFKELEEEEK
jgi:hypothetical protein